MRQRHAYSSLVVMMLALWSMTPAVTQERGPLWEVAQIVCKNGKSADKAESLERLGLEPPFLYVIARPPGVQGVGVAVSARRCNSNDVPDRQAPFLAFKVNRDGNNVLDNIDMLSSVAGTLIRAQSLDVLQNRSDTLD